MLTPHLRYHQDRLVLEDVVLDQLARDFGTPAYVYSKAALLDNYRSYIEAFAANQPLVCYAVKANSSLAILALLAQTGAGFDIVSGGELQRVLAAGGDPGKVIFSGVGKRADEIDLALEHDILSFNIESEAELYRVSERAQATRHRARISLRVNPDIDPRTHPYIATGLRSSKFGIAHTDALRLYQLARDLPGLDIHGIECHIGSQITVLSPFVDALRRLLELVDQLAAVDIELKHIDIGGGRAIDYGADEIVPMASFAAAIAHELRGRDLQLLLEPGRSIVGNAGLLLTRVEYLKLGENKNFAIVDAAMNDLIRPTLYDAHHPVVPVLRRTSATVPYDIVGPVCESGDWLARERALAIEPGDLLAVLCAGAYGMTMASNYNTRPRACELLIDGSNTHLIRERETFDDLIKREKMPDSLR